MPRSIDYEAWLGLPLADKDRAIINTAMLVAAVDQVLSEHYPGEPELEREKAGFIKHLYQSDDVPVE